MGGVVFMENQTGIGRDFISSFVTQSNLRRLLSDCDLVPNCLQHQTTSKKWGGGQWNWAKNDDEWRFKFKDV